MLRNMNREPSPIADIDAESTLIEPERALPPLAAEHLPQHLRSAMQRAGWQTLMPVQARAMPYLLQGRDIMVQSRTGSGKTGAFLLPALERLDPARKECQCLVLVPTRELAIQVEYEAGILFEGTSLAAAAVYGGVGYGKQLHALHCGVQLVVGTPGRILDHLLRRSLVLEHVRMLVFDEADRMLSIGFYPDMKAVQRYLPRRALPVHFFSATYPPHVLRLAGEFMMEPQMLSLSRKEVHIADIEHAFYSVKPMEKDRVLVRVLEMENPAAAIIFCNTKANVHYVAGVLQGFGCNADELSADLSQAKREEVLLRVRRGELRYLVATDVAARGIDIPEISHIFLYEPPEDPESYIHRAGRTARAGAGGTVISLVDIMQKLELNRIARQYGIALTERQTPDDMLLASVVGERVTAILEARLRAYSGLARERSRRFIPLVRRLCAEEEPMELLAMVLDGIYQENLHAVLPDGEMKARSGGESGEGGASQTGRAAGRPRRRRKPRRAAASGA